MVPSIWNWTTSFIIRPPNKRFKDEYQVGKADENFFKNSDPSAN